LETVLKAALSLLLASALPCLTATAAVRTIVGPTPIVNGDARGAHDLTVINEKLAFAIAVDTPPPYGVPRGAVIDVAPVRGGKVGRDRAVFADFIPNNWSGWPNRYHRLQVIERGPRRVVVRTVRDWGETTLTTVYTLESGSNHVALQATLHNNGRTPLTDLLSGFTLWPNSGFLFGVPGLRGAVQGPTAGAFADRMVAYDHDWSIALHAPYVDHIANGSRDMFRLYTLAPGASRTFDAWLQVGTSGDLAPVVLAEIERGHLPAGSLSGAVTDPSGAPIDEPVVVVEKNGQPYAWAMGKNGRYDMQLPAGDYRLYATAKDRAETPAVPLSVVASAHASLDFRGLAAPGHIRFSVVDARNSRPLDASITIVEGQRPLVEFLGRKRFFTELDRKGRADISIAPGRYSFRVSHGGGFLAPSLDLASTVTPNSDVEQRVELTPLFDPPARGWYSADLHHHADQAEAVTPPADLARSELAAGLDVLFVSDHDSTVNHRALQTIADRRGVPFLPSVELSASWGHFNAYPLTLGEKLAVDTGTATVQQLFAEARRLGALVIQVNHPFIPYGYFTSVAAGVAPGGFDPDFDLLEINASAPDDDMKVVRRLWEYWNEGRRYYLSAGTDTHDVWNEESGRLRVFAHPDGPLSAATFAEALKAGHAYVSHGPLIFPSVIFGSTVGVDAGGSVAFGVELDSIAGLKGVELISGGAVVESRDLRDRHREAHLTFTLRPDRNTWYALMTEDVQGQKAFTDPIWVELRKPPHAR
jgi:hypothetical protein